MNKVSDIIKNVGLGALGIGTWILLIVLAGLMLVGAEWVGLKALPYLFGIGWIALAITIFILLPLACFRKTRSFSSICLFYSSYVYGITLWFLGLLLTLELWGGWAVFLGLFFLGVGCVPFAMLATLFKGMWDILGVLGVLTILTFGVRAFALWLSTKISNDYEIAENCKRKGKRVLLPVGIIASMLLLLALLEMPYGYYTFLRLAVCATSCIVVVFNYRHGRYWASCVWGLIAVLFNPIVLVHFDRSVWQIIDFICAALFLYAAIAFRSVAETQVAAGEDYNANPLIKEYQKESSDELDESEQSKFTEEYGSKNTIVTKEEYAEIEDRYATGPIWQWFTRSSHSYWAFASRVADYFSRSLRQVQSSNPFVGIARLTFIFVSGFIIVTPLYMVIGPVVQIAIIIIAVGWTCLARVFGWHRTSTTQLPKNVAREQCAPEK